MCDFLNSDFLQFLDLEKKMHLSFRAEKMIPHE
jgi:hypothetical protein